MSILTMWLWGVLLLAACLFMHVFGLIAISKVYFWEQVHARRKASIFFATTTFSIAAFGAASLHTIQSAAWSLLYIYAGAISDFETALLFSLGAFTTYGSSGFVIGKHFVLLSQIEAMNGVMAFGITGAFLFALALRLHHND